MDLHLSIHKDYTMIQPINNIRNQYITSCNYFSSMQNSQKNYCNFDMDKVDVFVKQGEKALPYLNQIILYSNNEEQLTETLYILDRMLENGTKGVDKMYYALSRLNYTDSPYIQTFLAGIYRKIQVPEAFGPLCGMLARNIFSPKINQMFDPNEEIGGAIISYLSDRFRN